MAQIHLRIASEDRTLCGRSQSQVPPADLILEIAVREFVDSQQTPRRRPIPERDACPDCLKAWQA
jgi:hypothetical protein